MGQAPQNYKVTQFWKLVLGDPVLAPRWSLMTLIWRMQTWRGIQGGQLGLASLDKP